MFIGFEEDFFRRMEYIEFVCYVLLDYYKCRIGSYLIIFRELELCYIWIIMGEKIIFIFNFDEMFGMKDIIGLKVLSMKFSKEDKRG